MIADKKYQPGTKAVNARAVKEKDGTYSILLLNMSYHQVPVEFYWNGREVHLEGNVEYLAFKSILDNLSWEQTEKVTISGRLLDGKLVLKPYPITKFTHVRVGK